MEISSEQWRRIRSFFGSSSHVMASMKRSVPYCAVSTLNDDGSPRIAPISSLLLGENKQGFYFEEFISATAKNLERDQRVCVLILNNSMWFWMKTIIFGRLAGPPAVRLFGIVGQKREAQPYEIAALRRSIKPFKIFKGYRYLWGAITHGREIHFHSFEPVHCGPMIQLRSI